MAITKVFVYTKNRPGEPGAWTRYVFPYAVDDWCIKGDALYLRSADHIYRMDETVIGDQLTAGAEPTPFEGVIWYPWLDLGSPGVTKTMIGFDIVGEGQPLVDVGYNQKNKEAFTTPVQVPADSVPDQIIPLQVSAPSLSMRLTYPGTERWSFLGLNLYLNDNRMGT